MNGVLVVAAYALRESLRRRVFAVVVVLTLAFGGLYTWGASELFKDVTGFGNNEFGLDARTLAGATLLGLAMFGTLFLGAVLAVFLTLSAVRGDAETGLLQPLIVRPLGRHQYLAGRFLAAAAVAFTYVGVVYAGAVVITGITGDWWPQSPVGAGLRLALGVVVVAALSLLGSIFLTATANGIGVLMIFGAGLLAGLLGSIGDALNSNTLQTIANTASWVLPFEALYRDALRLLVQDIPGVTGAIVQLGPLGGSHDAGALLLPWIVVYLGLSRSWAPSCSGAATSSAWTPWAPARSRSPAGRLAVGAEPLLADRHPGGPEADLLLQRAERLGVRIGPALLVARDGDVAELVGEDVGSGGVAAGAEGQDRALDAPPARRGREEPGRRHVVDLVQAQRGELGGAGRSRSGAWPGRRRTRWRSRSCGAASSLSPGMPSSARKMSAEGPPVWEVSNGEAPPLPKPPPPEVSVSPLPLSPGGPGSPCGPRGPSWFQVSVASPAAQFCGGVASASTTRN